MRILSIDTSTRFCSVAVHENGQELFALNLRVESTSSSLLTPAIRAAADFTGIPLSTLDAVAVAKGPGSYTGLRVSASTAKGLCFALDKPLIAVNTLEAMALQVRNRLLPEIQEDPSPLLFAPMIDARRMEVFCAVYDRNGAEVLDTRPVIVGEGSFGDLLESNRIVFLGDGAAKCRPVLGRHPHAVFTQQEIVPLASTVGELAAQAYRQGRFEDVAAFEPFYLKAYMMKAKAGNEVSPA